MHTWILCMIPCRTVAIHTAYLIALPVRKSCNLRHDAVHQHSKLSLLLLLYYYYIYILLLSRLHEYSSAAQHTGTGNWITNTKIEVREIGRMVMREGRKKTSLFLVFLLPILALLLVFNKYIYSF
jgi:hypothetical protein